MSKRKHGRRIRGLWLVYERNGAACLVGPSGYTFCTGTLDELTKRAGSLNRPIAKSLSTRKA